jgi:quercetin dioxygenase-like cupin family protein
MKLVHIAAAALMAAGALTAQGASAQAAGLSRVDVSRNDISVPGREAIQVRVDFAAGAAAPFHAHPGEEIAYVLEGTVEYQLEGQAPVTLKAGDALFIPAGVNHSAKNTGHGKASELATYLVEKGKPLVVIKP